MTQDKTIVLGICNDIIEAEMTREKLKANGIESYLENENIMGLNPVGGVEVKVFSKDKEAAEKVLAG